MSKRKASPVRMPIADAAAAFGLTIKDARRFIRDAGIAQGDQVEVGALAAFIARTTMGVSHAEAA
jgi:hypothetical protein